MIPTTPLLRQHASLVRIFFIYCPVPQALFSGLLYFWNLWNPVLIWSTELWLIWDFEFDLIESVFSARLLCLLTFGPVGRGRNWITYSGRGWVLKLISLDQHFENEWNNITGCSNGEPAILAITFSKNVAFYSESSLSKIPPHSAACWCALGCKN